MCRIWRKESEFDIEDEDKSEPEQTGNISQLQIVFPKGKMIVLTQYSFNLCWKFISALSLIFFLSLRFNSALESLFVRHWLRAYMGIT